MRKSDIFENFVKIAQEKGLVSSSNDSESAKKVLEKTRSAGTLSAEDITKLYGIKPDSDIKYTRNIMEAAHLEPVVVSPSYDKLNGLVENHNERQDIILNILDHAPRGDGHVRKLAEKELVLSLVRVANDLDNHGCKDLRILADACLNQTCKKSGFTKEALGPLAIVGIVAALLGAFYAHKHLPNISEGLQRNYIKLNAEIEDVLTSSVWAGLWGRVYDNQIKEDLKGVQDRATKFMQMFTKYEQIFRSLERPKDGSELLAQVENPQSMEKIDAFNKLTELARNISSYFNKEIENLKNEFYKTRHTVDRGFFTSLLEKTRLTGGDMALGADDLQDIVNALSTFQSSINDTIKVLSDLQNTSKKVEERVKNDEGLKQALENQSSAQTTAEKPADKSTEETDMEDLEKELSGFSLSGLK